MDRFEDYWHPCVLRSPKKKVSIKSVQRWKASAFLKKDISALESVAAEDVMDEILALEDLLANVEAECIRYGVARASYMSVSALNAMLSPKNHYNWVKLARSGKKSDWFKRKIQVVEQYISSRLDVLDSIHMNEFDQWCSDPENEAKYMELQRAANGIGFGATVRRNIVKEAEAKVNKGIQEERRIAEAKRMEHERSINEALAANRRHDEAVMRESNIAMQMEEAKRAAEDAQLQIEEMRRRTEDLKRDLSLQGIEVFP